ncbi:E3 ubiquitin-protein ligase TRIM7-like isoform X2 [Accipiter gentilis]|uniref:E3 ubiquitin-protein ligase TRIM7-like isoform X2 n=1 Tax=Astur gentilis TaxID=8957 RepID=UPI002110D120|nr:E3 ubiquitin-protein ligase TRIM7-like isoform X2 [Accipiter gentilis]
MAECNPLESLQKEASCSICLDYFSDPVSINCGHSFCRDCITRCSGKSDQRFACPQCRGIAQKRKFRPNRELRNLAEIAKKLSMQAGYVARAGNVCPKHQEPLKLFCQEDQTAICVVCDRSHAHRTHTVAPIEEATQECKEQIQSKLKSLKDERERLQGLKLTEEKRSRKYLQQTRAERWKIMSVFKQLHQFQNEQERLLLMWLEDTEKQIVQTQTENDRKISMEISYLGNLIQELERMSPQPENKSLQDARNALTRYVALPFQRGRSSPAQCQEADMSRGAGRVYALYQSPQHSGCEARTFQQLTEKFPRVEKRLKDLSQKNIILKEALRKFKESLPVELDVQWANVTLDPDTANPHLILSEDRRSVRETVPQESIRPNWELANIIEIAKSLNLQPVREVEEGENLCKEHQEALKLFCEDEERLICVVCDKSKVHRNHSVVPVDEAAKEYKKRIEAEKQKIVTEYEQLHKFLEEQESFLLAQLEKMGMEIMNAHKEILTRLLEETTSLDTLIKEVEKIRQQPDCELLKDIKTTLSRCKRETWSQSLNISSELEKKFCDFTEKTEDVKESMEKFQGILEFKLPLLTQVTLDPNTAKAKLYLSEDCKIVRWGRYEQKLPSNPKRFKFHPCVLGSRGFTSGWHCWEVEISREGVWAIGVAKESVPRETDLPLVPEEDVWALCHINSGYKALTHPTVTPLTLRSVPQRVRICLDCQEGRVVFFDALSKARIFAFRQASFKGEAVYPWFLVKGSACFKLL